MRIKTLLTFHVVVSFVASASAQVDHAKQTKFTPTSINGKLTYVNGIIIYNFVAQ